MPSVPNPTNPTNDRNNHNNHNSPKDQDGLPSLPLEFPAALGTLTLKEPIPKKLAALGREVLDMVPRKRSSLEAYRQAATDLCAVLKTTGVRVKPTALYYAALRVKWVADSTAE